MAIEPFVLVSAMRELLAKVLPDRVFIDRHMINNVRIRARQRKRELEGLNIAIHPKHFDTSFVTTYKDTSDNYTEGMYLFVCSFSIVNSEIYVWYSDISDGMLKYLWYVDIYLFLCSNYLLLLY